MTAAAEEGRGCGASIEDAAAIAGGGGVGWLIAVDKREDDEVPGSGKDADEIDDVGGCDAKGEPAR